MKIKWFGQACFQIETASKVIVLDPFSTIPGLELPSNLSANIVTVSHQHYDHNNVGAVDGNPKVLDKAGVVQIGKIKIKGIQTFHDNLSGQKRGENIVFVFEIEGLNICHLGDLGHTLNQIQLAEIGQIDILMIPVGGVYTLLLADAITVVKQINPKIILPMHYKVHGSIMPIPIGGVTEFVRDMAIATEEKEELIINKNDLLVVPKIIILKLWKG